MRPDTQLADSPATLVAIIVAARKIGDRDLERAMRDRLLDVHGIRLIFARVSHRESEPANA